MTVTTAVYGEFETIDQLMAAVVEQIGDREAFVEVSTGERMTFKEWIGSAVRLGDRMSAAGVRPGDLVAVAFPSCIDFAIGVAGALWIGAIATGINNRLGPREINRIFKRCSPTALICDDAFTVPGGYEPIRLTRQDLAASRSSNQDSLTAEPDMAGRAVRESSDPAVIVWTSGTTGMPKGAWFDHRNLAAAVQSAGEMTQPFDRRLSGIPMAHAGFLAKIWEQLAMGMTLVLTPTPWTAESMLEVLIEERVTVGGAVPTQWTKLLELSGTPTADLSALRLCVSGTAPAAPELIERMTAVLGAPVIVRYAMTESPSISGTSMTDSPEIQCNTVGKPGPGVSVRLVTELGERVEHGAIGRVQISGPCVMRGYWNDPEQSAAAFTDDGWLTSGDLARYDEHGNLVIAGRAGDMYIRGGYNVYPLEVENVLVEHPAIAAAAVIGVPAPVIGEIGVAYIVIDPGVRPGAALDLAEARTWVQARLADYKAPDELVIVEALPLTVMAKVDKLALRATRPPPDSELPRPAQRV